ncbi:MAG: hypothetical protein WBC44_12310, partial [Planctomycetaceae bacterium]
LRPKPIASPQTIPTTNRRNIAPGMPFFNRLLGQLLGFDTQRPEKETGIGPDNLWALGELRFVVLEAKNRAVADAIAKDYVNQLNGSVNWFHERYDNSCKATPVSCHRSRRVGKESSPCDGMRVIDDALLEKLKIAVRDFVGQVAMLSQFGQHEEIAKLLEAHGLSSSKLVDTFTGRVSRR